MKFFKKTKTKYYGFTLIEALVLLFIFSLITITFYQVITVGIRYIQYSKNRLGALALANEKMEIARNLAYNDVGVIGGACVGNMPQEEDVIENGKQYHINTLAAYVDDTFDSTLGGNPTDIAFKDYKVLKITVSWNSGGSDAGEVALVSRFVPPGLEVVSVGDGILSVNIISEQAGGEAVSGATVAVVDPDLGFSETRQTDDSGNVMLVGVKEDIFGYRITVTKSGYETVTTMPPYPDTSYNPVDTHTSVVAGALNIANISQNKLANLKILTKDYLGDPVENIDFSLSGGRLLGTENDMENTQVYNFNESSSTNSSGEKQFEDISPGPFKFNFLESNYEMIGINTGTAFNLLAGSNLDVNVKVASKNITGALIKVLKNPDKSAIEEAEVKLYNPDISYENTVTTSSDGMAFFPTDEDDLFQAGTYFLEIKASNFDNYEDQVTVSEGNLETKEILMAPN